MKNYVVLFFILVCFFGHTQIVVSSKVINSDNQKPIPSVNVYIKNTTIGVVTNLDGVFQINIPKKNIDGILMFSAMGYEILEIDISELKQGVSEKIKLKSSTTLLDEVIVSAKNNLEANKIVQLAFDSYNKNFPLNPFIAQGFLRHTEKTKKEYKWLVEAAIEVYDLGFDKPSNSIKANVLEIRKSIDNRHIDTLRAYNWYLEQVKGQSIRKAWKKTPDLKTVPKQELQKAINHYDTYFTLPGWKQSFFYSLFSTNINKIRYYNQKKAAFNEKELFKNFSFKLDTIMAHKNNEVYKIKITAPKKAYKRYGKDFVPFGWIYIRKKDYAILEFEYTTIMGKHYEDFLGKIFGTRISSSLKLKFIEIEGKMYLNYMSYQTPKVNRLRDAFDVAYDGKNKNGEKVVKNKDEVHYFTKEEIIFTEIITDKEEIQLRLQKPWNDDLFTPRPYHEQFWKNYNVLIESSEQQKMTQNLERKVKLKEQFKKSN
jgi:hypothetical protein